MSEKILEVKELKQYFRINRKYIVHAVDGTSFQIEKGKTYGLVGESGSGKSTTGRSIIRLYQPTSGQIRFKDKDISGKLTKEDQNMLRTKMQMIFQDPMACLNPRKKVIDIVGEGLMIHHLCKNRTEMNERVYHILEMVGLSREHATRYPHQFSGGQRQRIGIAYLFIAHDLSMVRYISDHIGVLHLGHLVESGSVAEIFEHPIHPYTKSLLSAIPVPNPRVERNKTFTEYNVAMLQNDYSQSERIQIDGTHYVLGTSEEVSEWMK